MSRIDSKIDTPISGSISKSIGGFGRRIEVPSGGGGGAVTLADIQNLYIDAAAGTGLFFDYRTSVNKWVDTGRTTPIAVSGDVLGSVQNQSGVAGSESMYLEESSTTNKPEWIENEGIRKPGGPGYLNDIYLSSGTTVGSATVILAAKYPAGVYSNLTLARVGTASNAMNLMFFQPNGVTDHTARFYINTSANSANITLSNVDENNVAVLMLQVVGGTATLYCNNVVESTLVISGGAGNAVNAFMDFVNLTNDDRVLGWGVIGTHLDETQRQLVCDYFQQNAGVLA